jgi:hypothetical protein
MPAVMWSLTWQWKSHAPGSSGCMSATAIWPGSSDATSVRIPITVAVAPCQCGVCRSTSVPIPMRYQRTFASFGASKPGPLP